MIRERVETFLKNQYSRENFEFLIRNELFKSSDYSKDVEKLGEVDYKLEKIKKYETLGKIEIDGEELNILEFVHDSSNDPRITLTREAFKIMNSFTLEKALAVFNEKNGKNFRLSYLYRDVEFDYETKKVIETKSPPRRYSFYLGEYARINTPYNYLFKKGEIRDLNDLKDRFSVEVVNDEFYNKIRERFIYLAGERIENKKSKKKYDFIPPKMKIPDRAQNEENHEKYQKFGIRLIGRIIFCWFLKMKKTSSGKPLISDSILSSEAVERTINESKMIHKHRYYHETLEKLFFLTLNKKKGDRPSFIKDDEEFMDIPFLNGGLFEPKSGDYYQPNEVTEQSKRLNDLKIPDSWFKDFLTILETYNFTVDENSTIDIELSIDPEMLGIIFEKLLGEINPDSGLTERETTASFYTPRDVVEFMINKALFYFMKEKTNLQSDEIEKVISYYADMPEIKKDQKLDLIKKLYEIKILDPACGSGAFIIGLLQKIAFIMNKIDSNFRINADYLYSNLETIEEKNDYINNITLENKKYNRKLKILRQCLYGSDINSIAIELTRLRCFLSLLIEEDPNEGIKPLPNLYFKFITSNSLIGLYRKKKEKDIFRNSVFDNKEYKVKEINTIREQLFILDNESEKFLYKNKYNNIKNDIIKSKSNELHKDIVERYLDWNPFDNEKSEWFEPSIMFNIKKFDVIIANPPYLESRHKKFSKDDKNKYQTEVKYKFDYKKSSILLSSDIYIYFFVKSIELLESNGCIVFITQNSWLSSKYGFQFYQFAKNKVSLKSIYESDKKHFQKKDGPNINTVISVFIGKKHYCANDEVEFVTYKNNNISMNLNTEKDNLLDKKIAKIEEIDDVSKLSIFLLLDEKGLDLLRKISEKGLKISEIDKFDITIGQGLNEKKAVLYQKEELLNCVEEEYLKPIYSNKDKGRLRFQSTKLYIINSKIIDKKLESNIREKGIKISSKAKKRQKYSSTMILPRGVGRYFCAFNECSALSNSYVEIYMNHEDNFIDSLKIWLFLNSTVGFFLREIFGRSNLGGGMIKVEAEDLKQIPLYFDFTETKKIQNVFNDIKNIQVKKIQNEILTKHHKVIDDIVFDHLGFDCGEREYLYNLFLNIVKNREEKPKRK